MRAPGSAHARALWRLFALPAHPLSALAISVRARVHAAQERLCELNGEYENMLAALRTELEASKHEQLRYTLGYVISCASFGVVCYRFLM
jgi:hypothetical protein